MKHRTLNRIRAAVTGRYWLPCPRCGQMFGGHEWKGGAVFTSSDSTGWATCSDCRGTYRLEDR